MQLYSNNYKNVIIKTLHVEGKGFSEKDKEKEEKMFKRNCKDQFKWQYCQDIQQNTDKPPTR